MIISLIEYLRPYSKLITDSVSSNSVYIDLNDGMRLRISDHECMDKDCDLLIFIPQNKDHYEIFPAWAPYKKIFCYQTPQEMYENYIKDAYKYVSCLKPATMTKTWPLFREQTIVPKDVNLEQLWDQCKNLPIPNKEHRFACLKGQPKDTQIRTLIKYKETYKNEKVEHHVANP